MASDVNGKRALSLSLRDLADQLCPSVRLSATVCECVCVRKPPHFLQPFPFHSIALRCKEERLLQKTFLSIPLDPIQLTLWAEVEMDRGRGRAFRAENFLPLSISISMMDDDPPLHWQMLWRRSDKDRPTIAQLSSGSVVKLELANCAEENGRKEKKGFLFFSLKERVGKIKRAPKGHPLLCLCVCA